MAKFLVGGRLIHSHFLLSPFIKPAWCGEISLYSDLEPNNNPTKVESTGKMKNGNENIISYGKREEDFPLSIYISSDK